ncbi:hypothetical protein T4A_6819 [Trichinella pseudospiralis]|uniref:Uncharacterized protein n=1 Tax=Trichinella pseudospiralis TaxID=6337 RepID=A0A0V1DPS2_TRIPS|nr:hypothetical protein T4A_6819 [Trichinella pseudospiralis]
MGTPFHEMSAIGHLFPNYLAVFAETVQNAII